MAVHLVVSIGLVIRALVHPNLKTQKSLSVQTMTSQWTTRPAPDGERDPQCQIYLHLIHRLARLGKILSHQTSSFSKTNSTPNSANLRNQPTALQQPPT